MASSSHAGDRWNEALLEAASHLPFPDGLSQVFLEEREDLRVEAESGGGVEISSTRARGAAARGGNDGGWEVYRSDPLEADLIRLAQAAGGELIRLPGTEKHRGSPPGFVLEREGRVSLVRDVLQHLDAALRGLGSAEIRVRYVGFRQDVRIARKGSLVTDIRMGGRLLIQATLTRAATRSSIVNEWVVRDAGEVEPLSRIERMAERLVERTEAAAIEETTTAVVFAPGVGGVLIHELVGHALEADTVLGGGSYLANQRGLVAPPAVTVLDDPRRCRAPWRIDDDGEESRVARLLQDGRVVGNLHDLMTAKEAGTTSTGHGRRSSFQESVRPRMGCTFLAAGEMPPASVPDAVRDGIYVRRMEAAYADARTGEAIFKITDGDRIEHGRVTHPIQPMLMSVRTASALASIHSIADDLTFDTCIGACLRDGQPIVASVGAPTFCVGVARLFR